MAHSESGPDAPRTRESPVKALGAPLTLFLVLVSLQAQGALISSSQSPTENSSFVLYGYLPPTIINYTRLVNQTVVVANYTRVPSRLDVVGINDSTRVEVYNLTDRTLIASKTISRMELWTIYLGSTARNLTVPSGGDAYLKVVSDKPVAAVISSGTEMAAGPGYWGVAPEPPFTTFYPSTDGGFSGREFIFVATPTVNIPERYLSEYGAVHIFAVENARIAVYNATTRIMEFDASEGSFNKMLLHPREVYRVSSTGRILVAGLAPDSFTYLPSLTGGFVGRHFYGSIAKGWYTGEWISIFIFAHEDSEVSIYDMTRPGWLIALSGPDLRKSLRAGEYWFNATLLSQVPLRIDSTGNISVFLGYAGAGWTGGPAARPEPVGDDISFLYARPRESIGFYAPTKAVIFAPEDASMEVDASTVFLRRDEYLIVLSGVHTVRSSSPVVIQVLGEGLPPSWRGWDSWGSYLVNAQMAYLTYPPPPPVGGFQQLMLILILVAIGVALPIAAVFLRRRHARQKA